MKRLKFLLVVAVLLFAGLMLASAAPALPGDNLLACSWFRFTPEVGDTYPVTCGEWFRDNNTNAVQELGIPSPDALDGTAQQFTRKTCCIFEAKLWQIVESPGGLLLKFSTYYRMDAPDDLTIRILGNDSRYGSNWAPLWTAVQLTGGDDVWHHTGELSFVSERQYNFYMVEIVGHVQELPDATGASLTGVYFAVDGANLYLPSVIKSAATAVPEAYP